MFFFQSHLALITLFLQAFACLVFFMSSTLPVSVHGMQSLIFGALGTMNIGISVFGGYILDLIAFSRVR